MSAYTSISLTRSKAREILLDQIASADDSRLRFLVNHILESETLYNCYMIVDDNQENDDDRLG